MAAAIFSVGGLVSSSVDAFGVYIVVAGLVYMVVLLIKILRLP